MLKNMMMLEFSNLGQPYLRITAPVDRDYLSFVIELTEDQLTDGCITDTKAIARIIEKKFPQKYPICLSLACAGNFRNRYMLPKMSATRARMTYRRERTGDKHAADYHIWENSFTYSGGHVFDRYYFPRKIVDSFQSLASDLGVSLSSVEPVAVDVVRNVDFQGDYAYFYIRRDVCTLLLRDADRLLTSYDFSFDTEDDIRKTFLAVAAKYEMELDKKPITHYGADSDIPFCLNMDLTRFSQNGKVALETDRQMWDKLETEDDNPFYADRNTFYNRLEIASGPIKMYYQKLIQHLLRLEGLRAKATEKYAIFFREKTVYAKIDIQETGLCLYLADEPEKYLHTRYQCIRSRKKNFLSTPCLYRINSGMDLADAFFLINRMAETHHLSRIDTGRAPL